MKRQKNEPSGWIKLLLGFPEILLFLLGLLVIVGALLSLFFSTAIEWFG